MDMHPLRRAVTEPNEEATLVDAHVNQAPNGPTEADEQQVLESLGYVLNPATGVYEGGDPDGDE
jgi:hypothetical protein